MLLHVGLGLDHPTDCWLLNVCSEGSEPLCVSVSVRFLSCELTDRSGRVCLDHAAEICDRLLQESALPVQHVPDETGNASEEHQRHFTCNMTEDDSVTCRYASYFGRSAMSLTSAMTSLCSSSRCLRRRSFCCRGTDSGQNRHTSSSEPGP